MLAERILGFIADASDGELEELAAEARAATGTAKDRRLHAAAVASLTARLFAAPGRHPVLALSPEGAGGSRLVDEILRARGDETSLRPLRAAGVDPRATLSWLAARQRTGRPVLLAGTDASLEQLAAPLERRGLLFRLPAGSAALAVSSPGGPASDLGERLVTALGLDPRRLWTAWEPTAGTTPFLARWRGSPTYEVPHWIRIGTDGDGSLKILDLANLGSDLVIATSTRTSIEPEGFRVDTDPELPT